MGQAYPTARRREVDFRASPVLAANDNVKMALPVGQRPPQKWELPKPANDNAKLFVQDLAPVEKRLARFLRIAGRALRAYDMVEGLVYWTFSPLVNTYPQNWDFTGWRAASCLSGEGNLPGIGNLYCGPATLGVDFEWVTAPVLTAPGTWRVDMYRQIAVDQYALGTSYKLVVGVGEGYGNLDNYHRPSKPNAWQKPDWLPSLVPELLPISQPVWEPLPIPFRLHKHLPSYRYGDKVRGDERPKPEPHKPTPTKPRPPSKGTKERKFVLAVNGTIATVYNAATETVDVVECLYNALPKQYKLPPFIRRANGTWRKPSALEKAIRVWEMLDHMDWLSAFGNLVMNEIEDRAFGKLGQITAKANRRNGRSAGLALGPAL